MVVAYPEEFAPEMVDAAIAATRFGYGPRPRELPFIAENPRQWLLDQLIEEPLDPLLEGLPTTPEILTGMLRARQNGREDFRRFKQEARRRVTAEAARSALIATNGDKPFFERLVRFWTNHFTVSMRKPAVAPLVSAFEREAIRPNVTKRFYDMLLAVVRHPAMLIYFDNIRSVGPFSTVGRATGRGLNDNMAREILELHTVGAGAFTERDVREFSKMLSGWTVGRLNSDKPGEFLFRNNWHQELPKRFLGRVIPEAGVLEAEAALDLLSRSEVTGRVLARKMAQFFVTDEPEPGLVSNLFNGYADGGGSCLTMAQGLIRAPGAWASVQTKVKTPEDLVISTVRALGRRPKSGQMVLRAMRLLGQPPYSAPSPAGWPQTASYWLSPQVLIERLEWASSVAGRYGIPDDMEAIEFGFEILGPLFRPETFRRLQVSYSKTESLALLLSSPEFQRR